MFTNFFKLPTFEREKIIFKKVYSTIQTAINSDLNIKIITYDNTTLFLKPHSILTNSEGIHNYVIGKTKINDTDQFYIFPQRINLISNVIINRKTKYQFTEADYDIIKKMIRNGVQFFYQSKEENITIEFTKKGFDLYKRTFLQKPEPISPIKIENNKYILEFDCSLFHMQIYIYKFGEDAKIIKPKILAETLKDFYFKAYSKYDDTE